MKTNRVPQQLEAQMVKQCKNVRTAIVEKQSGYTNYAVIIYSVKPVLTATSRKVVAHGGLALFFICRRRHPHVSLSKGNEVSTRSIADIAHMCIIPHLNLIKRWTGG